MLSCAVQMRVVSCIIVVATFSYFAFPSNTTPTFAASPAPAMPRPPCRSLVVGRGYWDAVIGTYHEYGCARPQYSAAALRECLRGKALLFIGNSHLRDVLRELLDFLGLKSEAHAIDSKYRHASHSFMDPSTGTHVSFVFCGINYDLNNYNNSLRLRYDHIFLNPIGVWSMLFINDTPAGTVKSFAADFAIVAARFQGTPTTIMNIHYIHPALDEHQRACLSEPRLIAYRAMVQCAAQSALPGAAFLDMLLPTNTSFARKNIKGDGHHYRRNSSVQRETRNVLADALCRSHSLTLTECPPIPEYHRNMDCFWRNRY